MNFIQTCILGIVEGLTEFLPVSSTGHLILISDLLGLTDEKIKVFEIFIQLGAILAVAGLYRKQWTDMLLNRKNQTQLSGHDGLVKLGLTTLPILILGKLSHDFIKAHLFSTQTVAWGLLAGAILMLAAEFYHRKKQNTKRFNLSYWQALKIGLFQCLALWPGTSRSASSMAGAMFCAADRSQAAEYSFLAALPAIFAATLYDLFKSRHILQINDAGFFALGFFVALIVAYLTVKFFIQKLQHWTLQPFAYYRIALAILIFVLY